jgi:hypothetical protein
MNKRSTEILEAKPIPPSLEQEYADLGRLDVTQLREELAKSLHVTAAHLRRLAVIVRLLEERGKELADLRIGLYDTKSEFDATDSAAIFLQPTFGISTEIAASG